MTIKNTQALYRPQLLIAAGILFALLVFFPILADYRDFFIFSAFAFLIAAAFAFFVHPKTVYRNASEIASIRKSQNMSKPSLPMGLFPFSFKKDLATYLFLLIIAGFLINQFLLMRYNKNAPPVLSRQSSGITMSASNRTDQNIIAEFKQVGLQVPMLGTAHNHADLAVVVNGKKINLANPQNFMKSAFLHIDSNPIPQDAAGVLHMHAKNVPLWVFFRSLGMNLSQNSLILSDGTVLKNESGKTIKFYLNGKKVDALGNYVFQPLDKLLISYGPQNDPTIQAQINSVTNFAKDHQK